MMCGVEWFWIDIYLHEHILHLDRALSSLCQKVLYSCNMYNFRPNFATLLLSIYIVVVNCPDPPFVDHSTLVYTGIEYQSMAHYECDEGYSNTPTATWSDPPLQPNINQSVTCQADGLWEIGSASLWQLVAVGLGNCTSKNTTVQFFISIAKFKDSLSTHSVPWWQYQ